jgi:restriction system protein
MQEQIMIENNPTNVFIAFEMLLEEIETEIDLTNKVGARALEGRDYEGTRQAIERSTQATTLRDKLVVLRKEWEKLTASQQNQEEETIHAERRNVGRLQRGLRTPESAYYQSILKALRDSGGAGRVNDILEKVEHSMKGTLKKVDYLPLASDTEMPRWRNTAQWARNSMVKEGLLKQDSPRGIWEITDVGVALYNQQRSK